LTELLWPAPAKVNRFLHITGRRADGYHLLQTLFQFVDYGDWLRFAVRQDGQINRQGDLTELPADVDLMMRAARLLQQASGSPLGADIHLSKRLPLGGGLGGGSSDAATTLLALNYYWQLHWPLSRLAELGLQLGADVPVFIHGHAAWAEGIGEQLTPLSPKQSACYVLTPNCHVNTRKIFADPALTRQCKPIKITPLIDDAMTNVFLPVALKNYPDIKHAYQWLSQLATVYLSGSGACLFAICDQSTAQKLANQSPWPGFVSRLVNISPTHQLLQQLQ